jgi:hypothetical protein
MKEGPGFHGIKSSYIKLVQHHVRGAHHTDTQVSYDVFDRSEPSWITPMVPASLLHGSWQHITLVLQHFVPSDEILGGFIILFLSLDSAHYLLPCSFY